MKKLFLFSAFIVVCCLVHAQQQNYVYCELVGTGKIFSSKVTVQADFGQETTYWKGVDEIKDENGKKIRFNSMVDAMNFMGTKGWEFVQAYVVTESNQSVYRWLLKKEISQEETEESEEDFKE